MQGGRDDGVVVADRLGREALILHGAVQLVELAGAEPGELRLAQGRPDRPLDLRLVVADRRRRAVQAFPLLQPEIEELPEGRPTPSFDPPPCRATISRSVSSASRALP